MKIDRSVSALVAMLMMVGVTACASNAVNSNLEKAQRALRPARATEDKKLSVTPPTATEPVSRDALEAEVLEGHPSLLATEHRVRALVEKARAEGKLPPPELMADMWQVPFAKPYALDRAAMIMFTLRQVFPPAGALDKMAEATSLEARAEAAKALAEARVLVRDVDRAFARYAEAVLERDAHRAHGAIVEQAIAVSRARYSTGGSLGDVTRADLERARNEAEIARIIGMIEEARAELNGLLGRAPDAPLGPPLIAPLTTTTLTAEQAATLATTQNPEVEMADRMAEAARAEADAADREASVPMFSAGVSTFLPVNEMPAGYGVSLSMSLPWVWGANGSRKAAADEKATGEKYAASGVRRRMRTDATMALATVRAAERRYRTLQSGAVPAAARALDATRAGYASGGTDILMWLDAARMARDVELDLAMARGQLEGALADLDFAAGGPVPRVALSSNDSTAVNDRKPDAHVH